MLSTLSTYFCLLLLFWGTFCDEVFTNVGQLPVYKANDVLQVYHVRSKSLFLLDTSAGPYRLRRAGIIIRKKATSEVTVLQFRPANSSQCWLPQIVSKAGSKTLLWDSRSELAYSKDIDTNFWQTSTFLADMNGVVYNQFVQWLELYIAQNSQYLPYSVCQDISREKCHYKAQSSDTFIQDSIVHLSQLAVEMSPVTSPLYSSMIIISEATPKDVFTTLQSSYNGRTMVRDGLTLSPAAAATSVGRVRQLTSSNNAQVLVYFERLLACFEITYSSTSATGTVSPGQDFPGALNRCVKIAAPSAADGSNMSTPCYIYAGIDPGSDLEHYVSLRRVGDGPYVVQIELPHSIPTAKAPLAEAASTADRIIMSLLGLFLFLGVFAILYEFNACQNGDTMHRDPFLDQPWKTAHLQRRANSRPLFQFTWLQDHQSFEAGDDTINDENSNRVSNKDSFY
jgi:hypothetical protein